MTCDHHEGTPNYRGKKTACELCGREVRRPQSRAAHHFCWRCSSYRGYEVRQIRKGIGVA